LAWLGEKILLCVSVRGGVFAVEPGRDAFHLPAVTTLRSNSAAAYADSGVDP